MDGWMDGWMIILPAQVAQLYLTLFSCHCQCRC